MRLRRAGTRQVAMTPVETLVLSAYLAVLGLLAVYGGHRLYLLWLFFRHAGPTAATREVSGPWPRVTVQLPVFNERYVVERIIRAAADLDYPPGRLEIQVLDDSTDDTARIAAAAIAALRRERPVAIHHVRREGRRGYKAGALAHGLEAARGDLIAIFDADFVPPRSFLRDLVPRFADARVGMVQARWSHLNRDHSLLTRLQAILLDGHFVIEHAARNRAGLFFNFNGTAGIWRRACIESAGGWQDDTLTEDLDLSYRAQLAGWRFVFVPDVTAPAELPADIKAFLTQQHRWACGSVQTGFKLLPRIFRARVPLPVKVEAFFHLTGNYAYLLTVVLAALIVPAIAIRAARGWPGVLWIDLPLLLLSTASFSAFYLCSQRQVRADWRATVALIPAALSLGVGLCVNNGRAVFAALRRRPGVFRRTPKDGLVGRAGGDRVRRYPGQGRPGPVLIEALFALYFGAAVAWALERGLYAGLPFLLLFACAFLLSAGLSATHGARNLLTDRQGRRT